MSFQVIKCPYCGYEYMPAEILQPHRMLGNPKKITREVNGEIIYQIGEQPETETSYNCDNCYKDFDVEVKCVFRVKKIKPKMTMNED